MLIEMDIRQVLRYVKQGIEYGNIEATLRLLDDLIAHFDKSEPANGFPD